MMAQALQGIQQQYALNGFPMQAPYTQTAAQILQLDNMDPDSSPVRIMVQHKIVQYLKEREEFCNLNLHYLVAISKNIDEQFFKEAESPVHYMDFETVKVRLSAVLSSGSFGNSRYAWVSSAASSMVNSEQLPGIEVPDLSVQHGRAVPGSTNLPLCARGLSTHNVFSSERYVPNDHHKVAANFACSLADNIKQRPESLINTTVAPCVSALPKCSPGLGGGDSGGVHNGHIKDHFPGDAHQVDSPQRSTYGSSSSSPARCDRTTSSSAMTTFSIDSVSTANGQKLSTNNNIYSVSQGPSSLQYRECEKELEYAWTHPLEQSDQSNISSSSSSARCDRTTSSSAMTTFSIDSVPTANGQELSTNNNIYSVSQGPSSLQYRECEKELEYEWSHPLEQSDQSNITTGGQDLLYLYDHTKMCPYIKGECGLDGCMQMKEKLCHILDRKGFCREKCSNIGTLFTHYQCCVVTDCDTCGLVEERVEIEQTSNSTVSKLTSPTSDECSGKHRLAKRLKVDSPNLVHVNEIEIPNEQQPVVNETHVSAETVQSETTELPAKSPCCSSLGDNNASTNIVLGPTNEDLHNVEIVGSSETALQTEEELCYVNVDIEMDTKVGSLNQTSIGANLSARKKRGASILYALTAEELRDHMRSLNQHTCPVSELDLIQSKVTTDELQLVEGLPDQNTCSLCGMERLLFEPPPRFCALCFKIINSTGSYYVEVENGNKKASICGRCHHLSSAKAKYQKKFSYAETDAEAEWWVQCDKCKAWQHQICALFNPKIVEAEAEYTCAKCFLKEKDSGDIDSLELSTVLGAWELPRTKLSDHIEQRLSERLEQERQQRASASGKVIEKVPSVEGLTVRVVSSAARVLQVQPRFREFFKQEKYPREFPYKSKAILLFQKNQGVDVCLFAMYVQEYGSTCLLPNQRHVYLAYIDSVKYFRPEIKSANGEALRTFVYHEILIGYLDYCKKRGFVSCSIWTCPSTKRDDYVLYCHPTTQKMPKSDKLRSWYQNLIKKAVKEGVVVERNTLYDFFIQPTNECKANISAACLPYCENDFWPGEAERLLEKKDDNTSQKKETQVGRLLRVAKRDDRKGNLEDVLLVHRLGERMRTMKEDFIMLCLQQFCKHCHQPIVSGKSWACISCKNFHLCDQCHAEELNTPQKDRHPATTKQKHAFQRIEEEPLPETDDGDPTMESKYFDSRIDFLKHCQDNQYQFDTLRRAKHTTMMILYHLHDSACSACHCAMDQCLAWRCLVCLGCNFCDSCYKQNGEKLHIHKLRQTDNHHILQQYTLQDYLDGLVHASRCFDLRNCTSKLCALLKKLFFHGVRCYIRARNQGGCRKCAFMWKLLLTHSKHCDHVDCSVPRCRDIKVFMAESKKHTGPCVVED